MNLNTYNSDNLQQTSSGRSTIRFSRRGIISFSAKACEELSLKKGDKISVHQDEDNPADWYISINSENGWPLRENRKGSSGLKFNSAVMSATILDAFEDLTERGYTMRLSSEPIEIDGQVLYPIITSSAKQ
jgi:hypothetical protein